MERRPTGTVTFWVLAAVVSCFFMVPPYRAAAAEPYKPSESTVTEPGLPESLAACPGAVTPYEGEDQTVAELRAMRAELRAACEVSAGRLEAVAHRLWWVTDELVGRGEQIAVSNERLAALVSDSCGNPCQVKGVEAGSETGEIVAAIDAAGEAQRHAMWFIAGGISALLVGFVIWRLGSIRG